MSGRILAIAAGVSLVTSCTLISPRSPTASVGVPASPTPVIVETPSHPATVPPEPSPEFLFLPTPADVPVLTQSELRDLLAFRSDPACMLPCWNGVTPGSSKTTDIATFFAKLGIRRAYLDPIDTRLPEAAVWTRSVGVAITAESSAVGAITADLGLDVVSVYWNPKDGRVQAMWISYSGPPPQFDVRSLFSTLGRPDNALMDYAGGGGYRTVLAFTSIGALVRMDATPQETARLCLSNDELEGPEMILLAPGRDPLQFAEWITGIPEYLEDQREFTDLSLEEYLEALSGADGCVTLRK
jgi:hypothetical protein